MEYKERVFNYLHNLETDKIVEIIVIVHPLNHDRFIKHVKEYIDTYGTHVEFNSSYTKLRKIDVDF